MRKLRIHLDSRKPITRPAPEDPALERLLEAYRAAWRRQHGVPAPVRPDVVPLVDRQRRAA